MPLDCGTPCGGITITTNDLGTLVYVHGIDSSGCSKYETPQSLICRILAGLTYVAGTIPAAVKLVGNDCRVYDAPVFAETALVATDTSTIDFTTSGVSGHNLTGSVKVSAVAGNQIVVQADGLYVDVSALDVCAGIFALTSAASVPAGAFVPYVDALGVCGKAPLTAERAAQNGMNDLVVGFHEWGGSLLHNTTITGTTFTETHDFTSGARSVLQTAGFTNWNNRATNAGVSRTDVGAFPTNVDIRFDSLAGLGASVLQLAQDSSLLQSARPGSFTNQVQGSATQQTMVRINGASTQTNQVVLTDTSATLQHLVGVGSLPTTSVVCSDNLVTLNTTTLANGGYIVAPGYPSSRADAASSTNYLATDATGQVISIPFTASVTSAITGVGVAAVNACTLINALDTVTDATVPATADVVYVRADNTCGRAPMPAFANTPLTVTDSTTIDLTASGVDNHTLTADVLLSATAGNAIVVGVGGLYVPDFCTAANAVDTALDLTVPATADVLYVRADGTCGRAILPAAAAPTACSVGALATNTGAVPVTIVGLDATGCLMSFGNCNLLAPAFLGSVAPVTPGTYELIARNTGSACPVIVPARFNVADNAGNNGTVSIGLTSPSGQMTYSAPIGSGLGVLLTATPLTGSADVQFGIDPCNGWNTLLSTVAAATITSQVGFDASGCLVQFVPAAFAGFSAAGDGGAAQTISSGDTLTIAGGAGIVTTGIAGDIVSVALDPCDVQPLTANANLDINSFAVFDVNNCLARIDVTEVCSDAQIPGVFGLVYDSAGNGWHFGKLSERKTVRRVSGVVTLVPATDNVLMVNNAAAVTINLATPVACERVDFHIKVLTDAGAGQPITINASGGTVIFGGTGPSAASLVLPANSGRESFHLIYDANEWHIL